MANLLVMMEFFRGELLPASLEALGQARRLGTAFGLSVYALVPLPSEPDSGDEDLTARCGRYGADKVVMLTGEGLQSEGEMRFACYSGALLAACAQLPPRLFLLGDTPAARDIAPRLASRLGAAYLPRGAALEIDGQLILCDETGEHVTVDGEAATDETMPPPAPAPVLMTVPPGRFQLASGAQDAEMLIIAAADSVQTSDATPVAAAGFTEEGVDLLPLSSRLAGPGLGDEEGDAMAPALWRLHENADGQLEYPDAAQYHIALETEAKQSAFADYALTVAEKDLAGTRAALLTQLAQPAPPKPAIKWSSRSGFDELSHLTPTGELDGWGTSDLIPTGDTDTTREVAAVAPAPHPAEEPAPPPAAPAPAAVRSAAAVPIDAAMWEGFATPPALRSAASELRSDGAPSFELETADTAPVAIVAPSSQTSSRRSSESPRPAASARRPPSSQSPARSRPAPHPDQDARDDQAAKDPKDATRDEPPSDPGPLASAAKPHDWTEDP